MTEPAPSPRMEVTFPGGLAVDATYRGRVIHTDQPARAGGDDTGPPPFDLFLASIATCAGFYALMFCRKLEVDTADLRVTLEPVRDPETRRFHRMKIDVLLPPDFPEKYAAAVVRAVNQCTVKKHIMEPPEFEVSARVAAAGEVNS